MERSNRVVIAAGAMVVVVGLGIAHAAVGSQPERPAAPTRPTPQPTPRENRGDGQPTAAPKSDASASPRPAPSPASDEAALAASDALFATLSTKLGEMRDWAKFQGLFAPGAQWSMVVAVPGKEGMSRLSSQSIEKYVKGQEGLGVNNFQQFAIRRGLQRFGNQAHVWSTYEIRAVATGEEGRLIGRGIASMQLVRENGVWLIQGVTVQPELKATPIPEAYLPKAPEKEAGPDAGADAGLPKEPALK